MKKENKKRLLTSFFFMGTVPLVLFVIFVFSYFMTGLDILIMYSLIWLALLIAVFSGLILEYKSIKLENEISETIRNNFNLDVEHRRHPIALPKRIDMEDKMTEMREEIKEFAENMELVMKEHDDEKGDSWKDMASPLLGELLEKEFEEWKYTPGKYGRNGQIELLNIANSCMMLYHKIDMELEK